VYFPLTSPFLLFFGSAFLCVSHVALVCPLFVVRLRSSFVFLYSLFVLHVASWPSVFFYWYHQSMLFFWWDQRFLDFPPGAPFCSHVVRSVLVVLTSPLMLSIHKVSSVPAGPVWLWHARTLHGALRVYLPLPSDSSFFYTILVIF